MRNKTLKLWMWILSMLGLAWLNSNTNAQTVTTLGGIAAGYVDGITWNTIARFNTPSGLALDPSGNYLYLADRNNNAIRLISTPGDRTTSRTSTFANATNGVACPVAVLVDNATNIFVLNQGNGTNGTLIEYGAITYGYPVFTITNLVNLTNATAMSMDGLTNFYITIKSNTVIRFTLPNIVTVMGIITNGGTSLQGIAVLDNGQLALSDAGNNGIWIMNPYVGSLSNNSVKLTGFNGAGDDITTNGFDALAAVARFNQPANLSKAGNGKLVVADKGNNRVKLVDTTSGTVSHFYGVSSNYWFAEPSHLGLHDAAGPLIQGKNVNNAEARQPVAVFVSPLDGSVFTTEAYYHVMRQVTDTGLSIPQPSYPPLFSNPSGIALDSAGANLYIADFTNNEVEALNFGNNQTTTYLATNNGISHPTSVLLDTNDYFLYVLNQNDGTNGNILAFDPWGNPPEVSIAGLDYPTAFTLDANGNLLIAEQAGAIRIIYPSGVSDTLVTITNANVSLQGIALFDDGSIAVSDAGNHVIWTINAITKNISKLTGQLGTSGSSLGNSNQAKLYQPHQLARVGNNQLLLADTGNNRLVTVLRSGTITNVLNATNATVWFGRPSDPVQQTSSRFVPMRSPVGVAVSSAGKVYASETYYQDIRGLTASLSAPPPTPVVPLPFYLNPAGIALNSSGTKLYATDPANNLVTLLNLDNNLTTNYLNQINLNSPVDVALDSSDNLYVLNQGTGSDGFILEFDKYGHLLKTNAVGLSLPTAMTFDNAGDIYVAEKTGKIRLFYTTGSNTVVTVITNVGVLLGGIALLDDGTIAISDTGNHVIWQINPVDNAVSLLTGKIGTPGKSFGSPFFARLNQPKTLIRAAGNLLVTADSGNNQIVVIDSSGNITNSLISTNGLIWFGLLAGDPFNASYVPMLLPNGLALGTAGTVFTSEDGYKDIRKITGTGLSQVGTGGGGGTGTNAVVIPPTISPNAGYFPMGRSILVTCPNPHVYYTTDGTDPTTNSTPVSIVGNVGHIRWFNTTNDLTWLKVKAFVGGTNASATVSGQPVSTNDVGTPVDFNPAIQAGIGSSIVIPVVCNLTTNQQVKSYQFRYEIYPINNSSTPIINPLSIIPTNDFIPVVTAIQNGGIGTFNTTFYHLGLTNGIAFSTAITNGNNGNTSFKNYAIVQMLKVQIPYTANEGDTYGLNVLYPSATSDGYNANVPLMPMPSATIIVTNLPYTVGDSASPSGPWYNAGTFGDVNLDNSDVNQAFYAASGLRVPYSFSDVFNAMDVYPPDVSGQAGGDGQIRFLDWQTILRRSLRLDPSNWSREWAADGDRIAYTTNLVTAHAMLKPLANKAASVVTWPWYRQALIGGVSLGNVSPGNTVNVPVYLALKNGSTVSGLLFRTVITPQNGAPAIPDSPQFISASGVPSPNATNSFKAESAFGWSSGNLNYQSRSSNLLGWVSFTIPATAQSGQTYTVSFANVDGSPDLNTQYDFESRSATVAVNTVSPSASVCSDEWKTHFFGSPTNLAAADNADPDGDGIPNWVEFLAGTDPTNPQSKLQISISGLPTGKNQLNWLTAPGLAYELQACDNLATRNWTTIATVSGDGTVTNLLDANVPGTTRYYRLHILP